MTRKRVAHVALSAAELAAARRTGGRVRSLCGLAYRRPLDLDWVDWRLCALCIAARDRQQQQGGDAS